MKAEGLWVDKLAVLALVVLGWTIVDEKKIRHEEWV
jgi:hypothetical protein